ncbi:MAG: hypothetical protein ACXVH2_06865 [Methanobacterium sp.]
MKIEDKEFMQDILFIKEFVQSDVYLEWHNLTVDLIEHCKDSESQLVDIQRKLLFKSIELGFTL